MNNYITLDGYKYATNAGSWAKITEKPHTERYTLSGNLDLTYGSAAPEAWEGEIHAPVTARASGWGTNSTLDTTLAKKESVNFTDHFGTSGTVHCLGSHDRVSLMSDWDNANNIFYVSVRLVLE